MLAGCCVFSGLVYGCIVSVIQGLGFPVFAALVVLLGVQVFCLGVVCDQVSAMRLERLSIVDDEVTVQPRRSAGGNQAAGRRAA